MINQYCEKKIFLIIAKPFSSPDYNCKVGLYFTEEEAEEGLRFCNSLDLPMEFKIHQIWIIKDGT